MYDLDSLRDLLESPEKRSTLSTAQLEFALPELESEASSLSAVELGLLEFVCMITLSSMALHDTRPVDRFVRRQLPLTDILEIVALHSLSLGIVIGQMAPSYQSHPPVLHLFLHAFFQSLLHPLTYLPLCGRRVCNGVGCQYSL